MATSKKPQRLDHDVVKRKFAELLELWAVNTNALNPVDVGMETPILNRSRRVDVTCSGEDVFGNRTKYAFEIKTHYGDSIDAWTQLRDYEKAGYTAVLVADEILWPKWSDDVLRNAEKHGSVMKAIKHGDSISFEPFSGFNTDAYLDAFGAFAPNQEIDLSTDYNTQKPIDQKIVAVLAEGRNVPSNIADEVDVSRQYVQQRLEVLEAGDYVTNIGRGVYELVADPRSED